MRSQLDPFFINSQRNALSRKASLPEAQRMRGSREPDLKASLVRSVVETRAAESLHLAAVRLGSDLAA